jgi:hypothetical protein
MFILYRVYTRHSILLPQGVSVPLGAFLCILPRQGDH